MIVRVFENTSELSAAAATQAAAAIRSAIRERGVARVVAATGTSQIEFLAALTNAPDIAWTKVELFQLDEYFGLAMTHPASFSRYLRERLVAKTGITRYHALNGNEIPEVLLRNAGAALVANRVDVAFVGIGENGHLAFNDPPANFDTEDPYINVTLDENCRRQQVGEGWFAELSAVPQQAITMSIRQILKAQQLICVVPELRKAAAVRASLEGPVSPDVPASILRTHPQVTMFLDKESASALQSATLAALAADSGERYSACRAK